MDIKEILSKCDHTLLKTTATLTEIKELCDEGMKYGTASVCIPPSYVNEAKKYVGDNLKICTVIGFPNGYNTAEVKCFEAENAIKNGADEIDTVINLGDLKNGNFDKILNELVNLKKVCKDKILKVIIETCQLTDAEIIKMCEIVTLSGADFIKTSTGFSTEGATRHAVKLMKDNVGKDVKVKAAGGISTLKDAEDFISLGATRLGTSRVVKIVKNGDLNKEKSSY